MRAGLGILFLIVILGLPVFSTLQPGYYERYPSLSPRMREWRTSTHAMASCPSCHVEPGIWNLVTFGARSIPAFYSQLFTGPRSTNLLRPPQTGACRRCHTAWRKASPSGDLVIPHRAHVLVLRINCTVCHQRLVHHRNTTGYNTPPMTLCLSKCHDGRKASNKCIDCHTRKQVPAGHKRPDWLATHGKRTRDINCGTCHGWQPKLCQSCHRERPSTHVGNWKKLHQVRAKLRGRGCLFCHGGAKFCLKCHDRLPASAGGAPAPARPSTTGTPGGEE